MDIKQIIYRVRMHILPVFGGICIIATLLVACMKPWKVIENAPQAKATPQTRATPTALIDGVSITTSEREQLPTELPVREEDGKAGVTAGLLPVLPPRDAYTVDIIEGLAEEVAVLRKRIERLEDQLKQSAVPGEVLPDAKKKKKWLRFANGR